MANLKLLLALLLAVVAVNGGPSDPKPNSRAGWLKMHKDFVKNTSDNPNIPIIFFGDSITRHWISNSGNGKAVFNKYYQKLRVANYGIGGDTVENVLWRIQNGEVKGLSPKLVVLMIGTNNLGEPDNAKIAKGIGTIVTNLRKLLPNTKILLLGILPRHGAKNYNRVKEINAAISKLNDGANVFFLDMFNTFAAGGTVGVVSKNLFTDGAHLTAAGYEKWAQTMNPLFNKLIVNNSGGGGSASNTKRLQMRIRKF